MNVIPQDSPEWATARLGCATASRIADLTARTKTGWGASRANYMAELIAERLTGEPSPSYISPAMQWGTNHEEDAIAAYELRTDCDALPGGFVLHPTIGHAGASPDRFVGDDGLLETKCPLTATHIDTLLTKTVDGKYVKQMQWQMACTGRRWCDFISFDPRMPERMSLFIKRIKRDDDMIRDLEKEVIDFLKELDAKVNSLRALYDGTPANLLAAG